MKPKRKRGYGQLQIIGDKVTRINAASMACRVRELKVGGKEAEMGSRTHCKFKEFAAGARRKTDSWHTRIQKSVKEHCECTGIQGPESMGRLWMPESTWCRRG